MKIVEYPECHATVRYHHEPGQASVSFEVFEWYGLPSDFGPSPTFRSRYKDCHDDNETVLDASLRWFTGKTAWDGCTNIDFHPDNSVVHACGGEHVQMFTELVKRVFLECCDIIEADGLSSAEDSQRGYVRLSPKTKQLDSASS